MTYVVVGGLVFVAILVGFVIIDTLDEIIKREREREQEDQ